MDMKRFTLITLAVCLSMLCLAAAQSLNPQQHQQPQGAQRQLSLQSKETTAPNFIWLVFLRLLFGVASTFGLGENLSNVFGGSLVPPGSDYDDDDYDFVPDDLF